MKTLLQILLITFTVLLFAAWAWIDLKQSAIETCGRESLRQEEDKIKHAWGMRIHAEFERGEYRNTAYVTVDGKQHVYEYYDYNKSRLLGAAIAPKLREFSAGLIDGYKKKRAHGKEEKQ